MVFATKDRALHIIYVLQTIGGEVVPPTVPNAIPGVRVSGASVRPVPEIAAALSVPFEGGAPPLSRPMGGIFTP